MWQYVRPHLIEFFNICGTFSIFHCSFQPFAGILMLLCAYFYLPHWERTAPCQLDLLLDMAKWALLLILLTIEINRHNTFQRLMANDVAIRHGFHIPYYIRAAETWMSHRRRFALKPLSFTAARCQQFLLVALLLGDAALQRCIR